MNNLIPEFKKIKVANCIAIGGMIGCVDKDTEFLTNTG
jgi:hypothetical protein